MSKLKVGVITFPGSNCDQDIIHVLNRHFDSQTDSLWHDRAIENSYDLLVVPGGFSYGDYLRAGAIAGFAPAMKSLGEHVKRGGPVIGICNGFQILCEAGFLPGALIRNVNLKHICKDVTLKAKVNNPFTAALGADRVYRIPVSHSDGNYRIEDEELKSLEDNEQIVFRYTENPNGSVGDIAGVTDKNRRVLGMMPHPERAVDPLTGGEDGALLLKSFLNVIG